MGLFIFLPAALIIKLSQMNKMKHLFINITMLLFIILTIPVFVLKEIIHLLEKAVDKVVFPIK